MSHTCRIGLDGKSYDFPLLREPNTSWRSTSPRCATARASLRLTMVMATPVPASSDITYIDGDKGILRYRGIPIEQLAEKGSFVETAWLVIWGVSHGGGTPAFPEPTYRQ